MALPAGLTLDPLARRGGWIGRTWLPVLIPALALLCFATAQTLHGSGLIAAFVGGITVALVRPENKHEWLHAAEATGDTLSLLTWVVFGAVVIDQALPRFGWDHVAYAVLSLTVIRMLPMFLSLTGLPLGTDGKLFVGWFGPRGLVSIVFVIIIISDLHLTDGTSARSVSRGAFRAFGESLLDRIPVVRSVYSAAKNLTGIRCCGLQIPTTNSSHIQNFPKRMFPKLHCERRCLTLNR